MLCDVSDDLCLMVCATNTQLHTCAQILATLASGHLRNACALCVMHRLRGLAALAPLLASASKSSPIICPASIQVDAARLACQLIVKAAHLPTFAAAATARGFAAGPEEPGSATSGSTEERRASNADTSTSQLSGEQQDTWIEDWGKLIEKGDVSGQAELVRDLFGEEPEPVGPPLHELLNYSRKEEERAQRRLQELQKQEDIKQSR